MSKKLPEFKCMILAEEASEVGYTHVFLRAREDFIRIRDFLLAQEHITARPESAEAFIKDVGLYRIILDGEKASVDAFKKSVGLNLTGVAALKVESIGSAELKAIGGISDAMYKAATLMNLVENKRE